MIVSSCHVRNDDERSWVLLSVLVISTLYFALIALMLWESTMRYRAAQRFRARVVAQTLSENAAELVAGELVKGSSGNVDEEIDDGIMTGEGTLVGSPGDGTFHITAGGRSAGTNPVDASVEIWGRAQNGRLIIDRTLHSQ